MKLSEASFRDLYHRFCVISHTVPHDFFGEERIPSRHGCERYESFKKRAQSEAKQNSSKRRQS